MQVYTFMLTIRCSITGPDAYNHNSVPGLVIANLSVLREMTTLLVTPNERVRDSYCVALLEIFCAA